MSWINKDAAIVLRLNERCQRVKSGTRTSPESGQLCQLLRPSCTAPSEKPQNLDVCRSSARVYPNGCGSVALYRGTGWNYIILSLSSFRSLLQIGGKNMTAVYSGVGTAGYQSRIHGKLVNERTDNLIHHSQVGLNMSLLTRTLQNFEINKKTKTYVYNMQISPFSMKIFLRKWRIAMLMTLED